MGYMFMMASAVVLVGMMSGCDSHAGTVTTGAGGAVISQSRNNDSVSNDHRAQSRAEVFKSFNGMTVMGEKMFMDPALSGSGLL
ncbi:hypothetical protein LMG28138_01127 [Pararobbsia alpina]|uniref:Uncharacterized protein n=1 Tax=Pararobbsia alpina TaxID=621374 RepID=A0A6S7B8E4_9BURK|nr:hypothetical protein LMG28138_01127 [Pararobbsia alpina]